MRAYSKFRIHLTAFFITVIGLALSYRQTRAAFPLLPLAGLGGLPFLGKGVGQIADFKKLANAALHSVLVIKQEIEIVGSVFLVMVLLWAIVMLFVTARRRKVKRIIGHLSGIYTAMSLIKDGIVSGTEKKECEASLHKLLTEILVLFKYRFLRRQLRMPSYGLVQRALKKMQESSKVTEGQIAMVSQYLEIFETMSRW